MGILKKPRFKYVKQEDKAGCAIACMAMVLGRTYESVKEEFWFDPEKSGLAQQSQWDFMGDFGLAVIVKTAEVWPNRTVLNREMWKPFADIHIVCVSQWPDRKETHVVIMTKTGKIYDPYDKELGKKDYYKVNTVTGIFYG